MLMRTQLVAHGSGATVRRGVRRAVPLTGVMPPPFHAPVKRSITIAAHPTSISLEPVFWTALEAAAREEGLPLSALVACIDAERIALPDPPNLASALRVWLFSRAQGSLR